MAYLMKELGMNFYDALNFCRSKRPIVCPNMGFVRQLQEYERELKTQPVVTTVPVKMMPAAAQAAQQMTAKSQLQEITGATQSIT